MGVEIQEIPEIQDRRAKANEVATVAASAPVPSAAVAPPRFEVRRSQQTKHRVPSPSGKRVGVNDQGVSATAKITDSISNEHTDTKPLMQILYGWSCRIMH